MSDQTLIATHGERTEHGRVHSDLWHEAVDAWLPIQMDLALQEHYRRVTGKSTKRAPVNVHRGIMPGGEFALNLPPKLPAIWGAEEKPLWVEGEGFMIVGPQGVGKTTLAQQLMLARAGLFDELLGMPVAPAAGRVLYLAMDRPLQARRSLRRMVSEDDFDVLNVRISTWLGPLPFSISDPHRLAEWARDEHGATDVFVDSYKDLAPNLSDEATGILVNMTVQECLAEGISWVGLHHHRKGTAENPTPKTLHDVYGSGWLTAGLGSVLGLGGEPGTEVVEAKHLKQPAESLETFGIRHDHALGRSELVDAPPTVGRQSGGDRRRERILGLMRSDPERSWTLADVRAHEPRQQPVLREDMRRLEEGKLVQRIASEDQAHHWMVVL